MGWDGMGWLADGARVPCPTLRTVRRVGFESIFPQPAVLGWFGRVDSLPPSHRRESLHVLRPSFGSPLFPREAGRVRLAGGWSCDPGLMPVARSTAPHRPEQLSLGVGHRLGPSVGWGTGATPHTNGPIGGWVLSRFFCIQPSWAGSERSIRSGTFSGGVGSRLRPCSRPHPEGA